MTELQIKNIYLLYIFEQFFELKSFYKFIVKFRTEKYKKERTKLWDKMWVL